MILNTMEMALAIQALTGRFYLGLDANKHWYVHSDAEIGNGLSLKGAGERGDTPEEAITATWKALTSLAPDKFIVVDALRPTRRHLRWNGFMWVDDLAHPVHRQDP